MPCLRCCLSCILRKDLLLVLGAHVLVKLAGQQTADTLLCQPSWYGPPVHTAMPGLFTWGLGIKLASSCLIGKQSLPT